GITPELRSLEATYEEALVKEKERLNRQYRFHVPSRAVRLIGPEDIELNYHALRVVATGKSAILQNIYDLNLFGHWEKLLQMQNPTAKDFSDELTTYLAHLDFRAVPRVGGIHYFDHLASVKTRFIGNHTVRIPSGRIETVDEFRTTNAQFNEFRA
ncbi:MAG: hypothetical protein AAB966_03825, partial [Patescibacteria group bacterium]